MYKTVMLEGQFDAVLICQFKHVLRREAPAAGPDDPPRARRRSDEPPLEPMDWSTIREQVGTGGVLDSQEEIEELRQREEALKREAEAKRAEGKSISRCNLLSAVNRAKFVIRSV